MIDVLLFQCVGVCVCESVNVFQQVLLPCALAFALSLTKTEDRSLGMRQGKDVEGVKKTGRGLAPSFVVPLVCLFLSKQHKYLLMSTGHRTQFTVLESRQSHLFSTSTSRSHSSLPFVDCLNSGVACATFLCEQVENSCKMRTDFTGIISASRIVQKRMYADSFASITYGLIRFLINGRV